LRGYIVKRLLILMFLLWAVGCVAFFLIHVIPGDPVIGILGEGENVEDMERIRRELNLDKPLLAQYLDFNRNLLDLSLGTSLYNRRQVIDNIVTYLPNTAFLALAAMLIALLLSFPLGTAAAFKKKSGFESAVIFFSAAGQAIPNFFLGPLLILLFSIQFGWLPVSGSEGMRYLVLPALTLGTSMTAFLTRIIRTAVGTELQKPYVLLARAKGLSELKIFFRHVLKNAMIPIITAMGMQFGFLLTGAIVTETIFSWQGIGVLLIQSVYRRDYPMVQGLVVFMSAVYLMVNFLVDVSYFLLDPRIKNEVSAA
jgi:peptide/nickel transport system permease protein